MKASDLYGITVIESPYCPPNKAFWVDKQTLTVKHVMYFYDKDNLKEVFQHYEFSEAVKKYCNYVLDMLYSKIEKAFEVL